MSDEKIPCWLVWQSAADGGRPYLVAVDTSELQAALHLRSVRDRARLEDKVVQVRIEQSYLNHLYGESMGQGFDELKKLFLE